MGTLVIAAHILVAIAIIGLILLQQGKGAEMGASFGSGSSQTVFGAQGTGSVFSRATAICTAIFFVTSFWLALIAKDHVSGGLDDGIPSTAVIETMQTAKEEASTSESEIPVAPQELPANDGDIPQ